MDILEHLTEEHREAEQLMHQLLESEPGDKRNRLIEELDEALGTHMLVEERYLYPIVAEMIGDDTEDEAEIEHGLAREGLAKLQELAAEPGFAAAVEMLQAGIGHHVHEEESEIFPQLRERAGAQLAELEPDQLEARVKADEKTRDELYEAAKQADVDGRSNMSKAELAEAVEQRSSS
jgi:hemerythrin superfamily protein